ncbi:MAG: hypothetical protein O7J95_08355 [Planctomycetota bacterium]|nr:hypothetical protein [Planctomycetota bacterium]
MTVSSWIRLSPWGGVASAILAALFVTGSVEAQEGNAELEALAQRVDRLAKQLADKPASDEVDLSAGEVAYGDLEQTTDVLARPWHQNFTLRGYLAAAYLQTGNAASRPEGGFALRETAIIVEADVWEDISVFLEIFTDFKALGFSSSLFTREVYADFKNVGKQWWGEDLLNIKVGRFDIPFGEEYVYETPPDNPLILNSAHWWYSSDAGIMAYGEYRDVGWVLAVTNGTKNLNIDDDADKAINVKVYGNPLDDLYLSASFMRQSRTKASGVRFSGSRFQPVGAGGTSALGASSNTEVDALIYGLDARWHFLQDSYVHLSFGQAFVDDTDPAFDRDFLWWSVEAVHYLTNSVYAAVRYSEIGTFDSGEGYHFDGTFTAGGNSAIGYDARRFQRLSLGVGWKPNNNLVWKVEIGGDRYDVIDASTIDPDNDERWFIGSEIVLSF